MAELTSEIEFWPADEVRKLMRAFEAAKEKRDIDSLLWCADRMLFLYGLSEEWQIEPSAEQIEMLFNRVFRDNAPEAPPLIAGLVAPDKEEPEPLTAKDAGEALETVREFITENVSKKRIPEALENLAVLRGTITALSGEEGE